MARQMPTFTLLAKDDLSMAAVRAYRFACQAAGLDDQVVEVDEALEEFETWRLHNPDKCKLPDHKHVPAGDELPFIH